MFIKINDLPQKEPVKGFHVHFVHTGNNTLAFFDIDEGAILPEHKHPHEQSTYVIEGELEMNVAGEIHVVKAGEVAVAAGGVPHSARALTRVKSVDVFYPEREDYK